MKYFLNLNYIFFITTIFIVLFTISITANKNNEDGGSKQGNSTTIVESIKIIKRSFGQTLKSTRCPSRNSLLRFDKSSRRCYEIGTKGPCGRNMIFYAEFENEQFGICDCAYVHEIRTLIYHNVTNQCYFIFQRGYCHMGQWLTLNQRTGQPFCQTNPCLKFAPPNLLDNYVQYNGRCVELNSSCEGDRVVKFIPENILPRCNISSTTSKAVGAPVQSCAPGSYRAYNGKCQPNFVW